ncbi:hypothetical protein PAXRUDRAFT_829879 [Paxillus rubicundulus Ve08.2h10]|uniref:Uncharacterized protein n=1 Tax=Paxillus rubicundulus Ve08.2h10 TaxID=930991 RepID=A0A0D0DUA2_9AGAM|nr:hypothetical protein PAXRUDRAFT_829879 [Paxillus rubicundulus Ve08.2h10]
MVPLDTDGRTEVFPTLPVRPRASIKAGASVRQPSETCQTAASTNSKFGVPPHHVKWSFATTYLIVRNVRMILCCPQEPHGADGSGWASFPRHAAVRMGRCGLSSPNFVPSPVQPRQATATCVRTSFDVRLQYIAHGRQMRLLNTPPQIWRYGRYELRVVG